MIINGGSRSNGRFFAKHLTNAKENDRVTVCEIRSLAAQTVPEAFREMEAIALGSQCTNYFYHANINPQMDEVLDVSQWRRAVQLLEENLRLKGHARFVVEHQKKGRVHRHVIWLRIAIATMRAVTMTDDYEKHQATSRQLEREFELQSVGSVLGSDKSPGLRPTRRPKSWESFRGKKSGIDPCIITEHLTSLYENSPDAKAFVRSLESLGYRLTKGDSQDFCVRDSAGHLHSLPRRLRGLNVTTLRNFFKEEDGVS